MDIKLFTTTPQSVDFEGPEFLNELKNIARLSEKHGFRGTLIYSDNRLADPWMLAGLIMSETRNLIPMVALQPVYMHPYTVAKKISTLALLYNRPVAMNLIAGGFINDLKALDDDTPHDKRYDRLCEYTEIIQQLLTSRRPVTYEGEFYRIKNLKLQPELPENLQPEYYLSGSSEAAKETANRLGATLIEYPEPPEAYTANNGATARKLVGIRIGVLTRDNHDTAWAIARSRFPNTREGQLSHLLATKVSDSQWHKKLSDQKLEDDQENTEPVYWMGPFKHYQTFCPYLVGDVNEVSNEISNYIEKGCSLCVLDIPVSEEELEYTVEAFKRASELAVAR
ncbi:MAG: LLM class flavin-dependent oxidoreductase [Balneolia bacterium]|nr:LLM class flavin-dependent oxidoreductase [Balneolia bacterium]